MNGRLGILLFSIGLMWFAALAAAGTGGTGWEMRTLRLKSNRSQTVRQQGNASSRCAEDHSRNEKNVRTPVAGMPLSVATPLPAPIRGTTDVSPLFPAPPKAGKLFLLHRVILI